MQSKFKTRLTVLEHQGRQSKAVLHVIDVTGATTPAEAQQRIIERQAEITRSGSMSPLIVIDK